MKNWKLFLSFLLIFIFISSSVFASSYSSNYIVVRYNGKNQTVREVPVIVDGKTIRFDVPSFITGGTTFVPIRFLTERYGAEVGWDQSTKTATVKRGGDEIKLTIDSPYVYINGKRQTLPNMWIPKLVTFNYGTAKADSRSMVPLRFISETLGYEVGYDGEKQLPFINTTKEDDKNITNITNVLVEKGSGETPKVTIKGTDKLSYSKSTLQNPTRLVLDFQNAVLNIKDGIKFENGVGKIDVNKGLINSINISQFSSNPKVVRVVFNLTKMDEYNIVSGTDGKSLTISLGKEVENEVKSKVESIEKEKVNGRDSIVIHTNSEVEIKTMRLQNPERLVLDLMNSTLSGGSNFTYNYDMEFINKVRVSQFNTEVVRVVLDIKDGITNPDVKITQADGKITITPVTDLDKVLNYKRNGNSGELLIKAEDRTSYDVDYKEGTRTMIVEIPSDKLSIKDNYLDVSDGLISGIRIQEDGDKYKFIINFVRDIKYNVLSDRRDDEIMISFESEGDIVTRDKVIVIDAGHGGTDPGTIPNGIKEKDINLSVALKLEKELKNLGYKVIMTRNTDVFIALQDRAKIANENKADIFISLHCNSIPNNTAIKGVQVLYCPAYESSLKTGDNYPFAEAIMEEFLKGTGAVNKGIIRRPELYVLNKTSMPAVIVEMGFLTNPEEAIKLQDSSYQNIITQSIVKGVERYFEMY